MVKKGKKWMFLDGMTLDDAQEHCFLPVTKQWGLSENGWKRQVLPRLVRNRFSFPDFAFCVIRSRESKTS